MYGVSIFAFRSPFCTCRSGGDSHWRLPGDSGMDRMRGRGRRTRVPHRASRLSQPLHEIRRDRQGGAACRGLPGRVRRSSDDLPIPGSCMERLRRLVALQRGGGDDAASRGGIANRSGMIRARIPRLRSLCRKCFKPSDKHRSGNRTNSGSRFGQMLISRGVGKDQHVVILGNGWNRR
jgi:hypothetical protein